MFTHEGRSKMFVDVDVADQTGSSCKSYKLTFNCQHAIAEIPSCHVTFGQTTENLITVSDFLSPTDH